MRNLEAERILIRCGSSVGIHYYLGFEEHLEMYVLFHMFKTPYVCDLEAFEWAIELADILEIK